MAATAGGLTQPKTAAWRVALAVAAAQLVERRARRRVTRGTQVVLVPILVVLASAEAGAAREVPVEQARVALAALPALAAQQSTLTQPGARSAAS